MSSKVLVIFAVVCFFCSCWGKGSTTQSIQDIPMQPLESSSDDLNRETSTWRFWRPFRFWKWGNMLNRDLTNSDVLEDLADRYPYPRGKKGKIKNKFKFLIKLQQFEKMYYIDSHRTITRRDSSLIATKKTFEDHQPRSEIEGYSTAHGRQSTGLCCESNSSLAGFRPKGSVQRELVAMMFDSMLYYIVDSWEVIEPPKVESLAVGTDFGKSPSELTVMSRRRKSAIRAYKPKRSRSKIELNETQPVDPLLQSWFTSPDERAIIRFKNGNMYEGGISMKSMNGEGRFQWVDGTVYLGQFCDNEIKGKGRIQWKDDTWYEGDFLGNLRHGRGLYVDSRGQRSYAGGWHLGTKHGQGVIYFSGLKNSYDGDWVYNVRHGFGFREYCANSGYRGDWDLYVREGKGLMIWPNHDFYTGDWKNGVMSGHGMYIWDAFYNNSMSYPSMIAYRGYWEKGYRNGFGLLNFGTGLGIQYKGEFKKNKKHGIGKFITNDGFIIQSKTLFIDDNMGPELVDTTPPDPKRAPSFIEPLNFDMCDDTVGLIYHVEEALRNIDNQVEVRANIINDFIECNKDFDLDILEMKIKSAAPDETSFFDLDDLIAFEEESLRKAIKCYETELKNIYYKYATICNTREIEFTPILIRLYMWQFYYDCNVHEKGLTLVEIDRIFHRNPKWLSKSPHNPFEKIYFWQYLQSLIAVASTLYAKRVLPNTKPDTILATAFRLFMENDVLPGVGRRKGRLANGFGSFLPLRASYELYRRLGEPHTVRRFLASVHHSPHCIELPQPPMVDTPDEDLTIGRNVYVFDDEMIYAIDDDFRRQEDGEEEMKNIEKVVHNDLNLFNFGNLSSKGIIKIFSQMFPQLCCNGKIMDLEIELTFFEFFEAFITCAEESIRVKDEELKWREKFSAIIEPALPPSPIGGNTVSKQHK